MPEKQTTEQRHRNMAAIHGKDTKPEITVRKYLWSHGFRYRLNHRRLPGKPDIVLRKYRTCIFVNGCFWHGHGLAALEVKNEELKVRSGDDSEELKVGCWTDEIENSECCKVPHTNRAFWVRKIMRNKERDIEVKKKLAAMGWHTITVWECELKASVREQTLAALAFTLNHIFLENHKVARYDIPEDDGYSMVAEEME